MRKYINIFIHSDINLLRDGMAALRGWTSVHGRPASPGVRMSPATTQYLALRPHILENEADRLPPPALGVRLALQLLATIFAAMYLFVLLAASPSEGGDLQKEGTSDSKDALPAVAAGETTDIRVPEAAVTPPDARKEAGTKETLKSPPWMDTLSGARLPISIDSKEMTVKGQENKVIFKGAVRIRRGDVAMKADLAEVLLAGSEQNPKNGNSPPATPGKEITQIEVSHNVELTQGNRRVLAQQGIYNARMQEMIFSGDPEMWEDGYNIKGKTITLSLTEKRTIIEGSRLTIN